MEKPLTQEEIRNYKQRLLESHAGHAQEVGSIERDALEPSGGARFQPSDESVESAGLEVDLEVLSAEDQLGYEVHEALERINAGTFGRCEDCERVIGRQRLDQVPYARYCAPCAAAHENLR